LGERGLHDGQARVDDTVVALKAADRADLRTQPDKQLRLRADPGIGRHLLAGAELTRKIVKLKTLVDQ
jgi:hypothetical protein